MKLEFSNSEISELEQTKMACMKTPSSFELCGTAILILYFQNNVKHDTTVSLIPSKCSRFSQTD